MGGGKPTNEALRIEKFMEDSGSREPLDIENSASLEEYLRGAGRIGFDEEVEFKTLKGGVSNRTVLVARTNGPSWVLKQALPKLRVETDWFSDPQRIFTEAEAIRQLGNLTPSGTIPKLIFEDRDEFILAMEAVPEPHENLKTSLLLGRLDLNQVAQFATILSDIHRESSRRLTELGSAFGDKGYFESLRVEPYYAYTAERVPQSSEFYRRLIEDTRCRTEALVHGDYSPKNVLVQDGKLRLLDHEVIHIGDPAFDLGFSLTHFLSKANHLPELREDFIHAAIHYYSVYLSKLGSLHWTEGLGNRVVKHTLGCLLARVSGRSPLEYLSGGQSERQKKVVLELMSTTPPSVMDLANEFSRRI